jgi:hypothetical protein
MYTVTRRERAFTLAGIMVALLLGALDQTIVATAMPKILQTLNGLNLYTWVVTGRPAGRRPSLYQGHFSR